MADTRFDEITSALASDLPPARFLHTLGVLHTATVLAEGAGADLERVQYAALLHDCAKALGRDELLNAISEYGISVDEEDLRYPAILHGPVGAEIARRRFGVEDTEVLEAIHHHPVGSKDPSLTLQVLMAADYCEPTRDFPGVEEFRTLVRRDFRSGLLTMLRHKSDHLLRNGRTPHTRAAQMISCLEVA